MTPVWRMASGRFAGWYSNDALYDELGRHVGYLAGTAAYSLAGKYLGEIHRAEWIGKPPGERPRGAAPHARGEDVAHARLADRTALALAGWSDPDY